MAKLRNGALIDKDSLIIKLKHQVEALQKEINAFKEYDKKREEYYKFLVEDWQHSEARHIIEGLQEKIKTQGKMLRTLQDRIHAYKVLPNYNMEEVENIVNNWRRVEKQEEIDSLKKQNASLLKKNSELVENLISIKRKFNVY